MTKEAHKGLLDTDKATADADKLRPQLDLLRELVNYGTNLIVRCINESGRKSKDAVLLGSILKHFVTMLDACEVLLRNGAVYAARTTARSMFESLLYFQWIVLNDSDRRARAYLVAEYRKLRLWSKRMIPGTAENAEFKHVMDACGPDATARYVALESQAKARLADVDTHLAQPELKPIDDLFELENKKRGFDPPWHAVLGPRSIRKVAEAVGKHAQYDTLYAHASSVVHNSSASAHIEFDGDEALLLPIRYLIGADELISNLISWSLDMYMSTLTEYRPDELPNFRRKYEEEWRQRFRSIPRIVVK